MLKLISVCLFIGLAYCHASSNSTEFPTDLQKCNRGDNECIRNGLLFIIKNYPHGNPSLNLPSLEPIHAKKLDIINGKEGDDDADFHINWNGTNLEFSGFTASDAKYTIRGFEKDIEGSNVTIKIELPKLIVTGGSEIRLKFKKHFLYVKGNAKIIYDNIDFEINFRPTTFTKNGKEYLKIKSLTSDYIPRNIVIYFGELFDGDKDLNDKEYAFINQHSTEYFYKIKEFMNAEYVIIFTNILDSFFANFSIDELFLDDK